MSRDMINPNDPECPIIRRSKMTNFIENTCIAVLTFVMQIIILCFAGFFISVEMINHFRRKT
jgi:hypothetical protein